MGPPIAPYELEDDLLAAVRESGPARVRVYAVERPVVVLGRGSRPEVELELESCLADGIPLQRRRGGGCSVVLDPGNVLVAAALPAPGIGDNMRHFDRLCRWLIDGLAEIGVPGVERAGISDLVLGDRKVAGCCIYRRKDLLLYSAALLVEPDVALMERYLSHPPREPDYRRGRRHRDFVTRLGDVPGAPPAPRLGGDLERVLGVPEPAMDDGAGRPDGSG